MKEKKTAYAALVVHEENFDAEVKVMKIRKYFSRMLSDSSGRAGILYTPVNRQTDRYT